ncbi:hypothetical protein [Paraburkholderia fungorum]|jgi:hypothetical protein|uniref:hypothetical protein n=1 Tax=Paraburkholderia fungorum TaxID=134537 RepID=UPI002093B639|nr:hypothetical protein [Paraburkholderia fungorum]USU17262.1 hypothetical protein NFE55_05685 [Paraburkholderia fungorum]USU25206.1 hypothetical protein NFS19_05685 [Paraburkholderia fungorum]
MKIARLIIALGLACAASSTVMAAAATYPPAPLPAYAQDELQKVIDAATGPLPAAAASSAAPQNEATRQSPAVLHNGPYAVPPADEPHAARSVGKRGIRPAKAHRHEHHKYV